MRYTPWPAFVGPSYTLPGVQVACQRSVNLYPERLEAAGERAQAFLHSTPGITPLVTLDQGPVRGLFHRDGRAFAIGGLLFYELVFDALTKSLTPVVRGVVALDDRPAFITSSGDDGHELLVVAGGQVQFYNLTTNVLSPSWVGTRVPIASSSAANPTVVTTDTAHGLTTGDRVLIADHTSTPPLSGAYVVTVTNSTHFTVPVNVTVAGTGGHVLRTQEPVVGHFGGFLDGYFLALDAQTSTLELSGLADGQAWDPLQVARRTWGADRWRSMCVANGLVFLFGSETSEVWYHAGAAFPLAPIQGAFIQQGIAAPYSAAVCDNSVFWLGQSAAGGLVISRMGAGFQAQRVSTHAVEAALGRAASVEDAVGWAYAEDGHSFYVLNLPSADANGATWVYDASTGLWHERGWWGVGSTEFAAQRQQTHCHAYGMHLVGDRSSGVIYRQSLDLTCDADGATLRALRRMPHLKSPAWMFHRGFELDAQMGVGSGHGPGANPQALLRWSDYGGLTWSAWRAVALGRQGEFDVRAEWRRLGRSRNRVYELVITDPVPRRLVQASLAVEQES